MNIGIVTTWFERGAGYVSRAYKETLSKDHNVFIFARGGEAFGKNDPNWDLPNVTWSSPHYKTWSTYINFKEFKSWLKKNAIDIILFNEQRSWDIILKLKRSNYLLGAYVDYYTPETVPFFNLYDFLLCNTKRHFQVFSGHRQAIYIPWGTNTKLCSPVKKENNDNVVSFFHSAGTGGSNLRKGTDILVRAFQRINGNARLIIHSQVGLERYSDIAEIIQRDNHIKFIHKTVPLPGLYSEGQVYVYPTRLEGIGLSVVEALSCGLPVITTDCSPMNEFVENGKTGFLVKVSEFRRRGDDYYWPESICSEDSLAKAMQTYIDDPSLIHIHSTNARNYAEENLDWGNNSKDLCKLIVHFKKVRSWDKKDIESIKKYEEKEQNYYSIDYLFKLLKSYSRKGDKKGSLAMFFTIIHREPKLILKRTTWSYIRHYLF